MKLPSLSSLLTRTGNSFLRFPLAILLAVTGTIAAIVLVHHEVSTDDTLFIRISNAIVSCYLGMLLSIAATVWAERKAWRRGTSISLQTAVLILTAFYYFLMPDHFEEKTVIRWMLYGLGLHLLIAVIGFAGSPRIDSFWQYNKDLFLRILTSVLYTMVLYSGLALALLAVDKLFDADLNFKWYSDLWFVLIGIFNTWFFLAGFPTEYGDSGTSNYPKGLKIFTQYVLLPLLTVYMGILYVYLFKIVFTAHWPSGWVAYLVLGFSVAGILALLLIYPIRNEEQNKWINGYSRFFYFALLPLLMMLGVAIWKRVNAYGITEWRYFVIVLALWLLLMAIYFLASRKKNILLIPLTLCLFAFLSSFGPWGVFHVSLYSQQNRWKVALAKAGLFKDDRLTYARKDLSLNDRKEISSITAYLVDTHGYGSLQPWFKENLDSLMRRDSLTKRYRAYDMTESILQLIHVEYASRYLSEDTSRLSNFNCLLLQDDIVIPTDGLPYMILGFSPTAMTKEDSSAQRYLLGRDSINLTLDSAVNQLRLLSFEGAQPSPKDSVCGIDLTPVLQNFPSDVRYGMILPMEKMTVPIHCMGWKGKLIVTRIDGISRNGALHVTELKGHLLLGPVH